MKAALLGIALLVGALAMFVLRPANALLSMPPLSPLPRGGSAPSTNVVIGSIYSDRLTCATANNFETWLGLTAGSSYFTQYWTNISNGGGTVPTAGQIQTQLSLGQCGHGASRPQEISLSIGDTAAAITGGSYDTFLANFASALNTYAPNAIVRYCWEFNIGTTCVGYTAAQFVSVFQYVATKLRAGAPGIKMEWTPGRCTSNSGGCSGIEGSEYPGNSYVDVIGLDIYDIYESGSGTTTDWNDYWLGVNSPTTCCGLDWQVSFAQAHNKLMNESETGVGCGLASQHGFACSSSNGAIDDPHGASMWALNAAWVKNTSSVNGYRQYTEVGYWNNNAGGYCGVIDDTFTDAGGCPGGDPGSFGSVPPSSFPAQYGLPQSAQAMYTAFHAWQ